MGTRGTLRTVEYYAFYKRIIIIRSATTCSTTRRRNDKPLRERSIEWLVIPLLSFYSLGEREKKRNK